MADRKYNDSEVGEILKAAAEMQSGLLGSATSEGMTLSELKQVAEEIGIHPDHIGLAAAELGTEPKGKPRHRSDTILVEQSVSGELTDDTWEDIVSQLRNATGNPGRIEFRGNSREWVGGSDLGSIMFSATPRRGRTRLKLLGDTSGNTALMTAFGCAFGLLLTLVPVIFAAKMHPALHPLLTFLLTLLVAGLCLFATNGIINSFRKRFSVRLESLLGSIVAIAETQPTATVSSTQALDSLSNLLQTTSETDSVPLKQVN